MSSFLTLPVLYEHYESMQMKDAATTVEGTSNHAV